MSRSFRHTPAIKIAGSSDKQDKRKANRKFRHSEHIQLSDTENINDDTVIVTDLNEVSNRWGFASDGGAYYQNDLDEKYLRK